MILAGMGASPVRFVGTDETRNIGRMQVSKAFSSEVAPGSREENALKNNAHHAGHASASRPASAHRRRCDGQFHEL
jgi:hypothetical protein